MAELEAEPGVWFGGKRPLGTVLIGLTFSPGLGPGEEALEPVGPREEPAGPKEEPVGPKEEPVGPKEEPVGPKEEPVGPKEEDEAFMEQPVFCLVLDIVLLLLPLLDPEGVGLTTEFEVAAMAAAAASAWDCNMCSDPADPDGMVPF